MTEYRASVRRPGRVFFLLVLSLAGFGVGIWQAMIVENYHDAGRIMAFILPATVIAIGLSAANGFRRHCWRLEAGGISIREGPSVPLTGLSRSFFVAWSEIASLEMSGEYALRELHLILRNGQAFRIAQKMVPNPMSQFQMPDPDALLDDLEAAIRMRVAALHPGLPATARNARTSPMALPVAARRTSSACGCRMRPTSPSSRPTTTCSRRISPMSIFRK